MTGRIDVDRSGASRSNRSGKCQTEGFGGSLRRVADHEFHWLRQAAGGDVQSAWTAKNSGGSEGVPNREAGYVRPMVFL